MKCIWTLLVTCRFVYFNNAGMTCSALMPVARPIVMRVRPSDDSSLGDTMPPISPPSTASSSFSMNVSAEPVLVSS